MKKDNIVKEKKSSGKKGLKILIIILVIIVVIAGSGFGGYFAYKKYSKKSETKSTGSEWGDIYYNYIKDNEENDTTDPTYNLNKENGVEIGFAQTDVSEKPIMYVNGTTKNEDNSDTNWIYLYEINENNEVDFLGGLGSESLDVEFLYDVPNKKYDYFIHTSGSAEETYTSLNTEISDWKKSSEIRNKIKEEKGSEELTDEDNNREYNELEEYKKNDTTRVEYTILKDEETVTQNTLAGDVISYDKKDEYIIDTGIEEKKFHFSEDMEIAEVRDNIEAGVSEYKTNEELATDDIKTTVEEKVQATETTKQQIETAKAEIKADEEKKAAEEAKKKEEEELKKGLKVGSYRLKYGTYKTDAAQMGGDYYGTLELKPNGEFHIKSNCDVYKSGLEYEKLDCDGTYKVTKVLNSFEYFDGLKFTTSTGKTFEFEAVGSTDGSVYLGDQWHRYIYQGN